MAAFWRCGGGNNSGESDFSRENSKQTIEHGQRRFANRYEAQVGGIAKIVFDVSAANDAVGTTDAAGNGGWNVQSFQRSQENLPCE